MPTINLLDDFYRRANQRRLATGFGLTQQESGGAIDAGLGLQRDLANRSMQYDLQNRDLMLREQAQRDTANAQRMGGYAQLAMLPLAYGAAKHTGLIPPGFQLTSPSTWGGGTAQGSLLGGAGGAGGMEATQLAGPAGTGLAEGAGQAGVMSSTPGLLGVAGGTAFPSLLGAVGGGLVGRGLSGPLGTHKKSTGAVGSIVGGAAAGAYVGSGAGPWGTAIGGIIGGLVGGISSLF